MSSINSNKIKNLITIDKKPRKPLSEVLKRRVNKIILSGLELESDKDSKVLFKIKGNWIKRFDISRKVCEPFGIFPWEIFTTPLGKRAIVIGVRNSSLWYINEWFTYATNWSKEVRTRSDFIKAGFKFD